MKKIFAILSAFLALVISGCASTPESPQRDQRFGTQVPPPQKAPVQAPATVSKPTAEQAPYPKPPNGSGPNMFESSRGCFTALFETGNYRYYEPRYFGLKGENPVNGKTRVLVQSERDWCYKMQVVGGKKWVVQKEGTEFRHNKMANGHISPQPYARHSCGNPVYEIGVLPTVVPASKPAPKPETKKRATSGEYYDGVTMLTYVSPGRIHVIPQQQTAGVSIGVGIAMGGGYNTGYSGGHYGHGQSSIWSGSMHRPIGHAGGGFRPVQRPLNLPSYTTGQPIGMNVGGVAPNTGGFIIPQTGINPITGIPGSGQGPQTGTFTIPGVTTGVPAGDTSGGVFGGGTFGGPSVYTGPIYYYGGGGGPSVYTNPSTGGTTYYYGGSPGVMTNSAGGIYFGGGVPGVSTGGSGSLGVTTNPIGGGTPGAVTGSSGPGVSTGSSGPSVTP